MKKAIGQTVRDLKREVNKKVLKVPSIEQKVLDATSNEPWGPHGTLLADIAQATKNYHEYQMIMSVIWKRVNDTGKNWRHVYKALTVLDYLVAHGSERVIDDIREHAYQISTLSDFQYIDSNGRDQGNNVRKKSQSLVVLVNDKERIQEVRQKAAVNREKYRNTSAGSMYRPGSGGYGDKYDDRSEGRYGSRDDDRNGYGRDSEERYGRDGYRDDDYRGRSQSIDSYNYGSRSRSADPDRERVYEDDGQYSSRGSGAKADDHSQDGSISSKRLERRYSEQNLGAPPSYEEVVGGNRSPTNSDRDRESSVSPAPKPPSTAGASPNHATTGPAPPPFPASPPAPSSTQATAQVSQEQVGDFDEFDPRGSFSASTTIPNGNAPPASSGNAEIDSLSNALALVLVDEPNTTPEASASENFSTGPTFSSNSSTSVVSNQPFDDPFGDGPFRANSFNTNPDHSVNVPPTTNPQFLQQEPPTPNQDFDILADILPHAPSSFPNTQQSGYPNAPQNSFPPSTVQPGGYPVQPTNYHPQPVGPVPQENSYMAIIYPGQDIQPSQMNLHSQNSQNAGYPSQMGSQSANSNLYGQPNFLSQGSQMGPQPPQMQPSINMASVSATPSSAIVPQPSNDKFHTKSTIWADTLSRGLVNLNISGSKTNPMNDIGVDFDAINRKDKRMEKPSTAPVTSTITMGKAMGSGSGMGRAGAGGIRPPQNPMMGSGMNMAGGPGPGMNMGGGYGMNQQMGRGMGPGMGMNMNQQMGMNMGMGQGGVNMQQQTGFPSRPGGYNYNPMTGSGNYGQQQYGGGYR